MTEAPPGWYPDPGGGSQPRWWTGSAWAATAMQTDSVVPVAGRTHPALSALLTVPLVLSVAVGLPALALVIGGFPRGFVLEANSMVSVIALLACWQERMTAREARAKRLAVAVFVTCALWAIAAAI